MRGKWIRWYSMQKLNPQLRAKEGIECNSLKINPFKKINEIIRSHVQLINFQIVNSFSLWVSSELQIIQRFDKAEQIIQ